MQEMPSGSITAQREELSLRLADLRAYVRPDSADALLDAIGALEVAEEELRVADEEMSAQRAEIARLVSGQDAEQLWRERITGAAPLALLQTRADGTITAANPAAAALLARRPVHLEGQPIVALFRPDDRSAIRDAISALGQQPGQVEISAVLSADRALPVTVVGSSEITSSADGSLGWALITTLDDGPVRPGSDGVAGESARALAEMCVLPVAPTTTSQEMLHRLAELTHRAIPAASGVSITLGSPLEPEQLSGDDTLALQVDAAQLAVGQGPCVDAFRSGELVVSVDLAADDRWPSLSSRLRAAAVGGALAVPILAPDTCLGVVTAYAERQRQFESRDIELARLAGASVSAVIRAATDRRALTDMVDNLETALASRAVIDQAKGIVMARHRCTADEAFVRLSTISQRSNVKLREVARMLVEGTVRGD